MTSREMHYDFKQKLNLIDSQKNRNLLVPEIDWKLNEAQEVFCKIVAQPRIASQYGFERTQRTIDDIRTIVVNQTLDNAQEATVFDESSFKVGLPEDYWFYVGSRAYVSRDGKCKKKLRVREVQHDDEAELSHFDKSSFDWVTNIRFINKGIRLFTDGTFEIEKLILNYLKQPRMIHNAQDFINGEYTTMTGVVLKGSQDCELPITVHKDIVDLAVLITAGDLNLPEYGYKQNKINLTK